MQGNGCIPLTQRCIIDTLIGDRNYGNLSIGKTTITVAMPYLSGSNICDLAIKFGKPMRYMSGAMSRWKYFEILLTFCIHNKKEESLINDIFLP